MDGSFVLPPELQAKVNAVQRVVIVQHIVGVDVLDLRHRADVAGDDLRDLAVLLALEMKDVPQLDRLLVMPDEDLRLPGDLPLVHAEDRELADERVGGDLEHVREQGAVAVLLHLVRALVGAFA